jgi:galactokinase/mevalonate kinase-like predicted kinase
LDLTIKDKLEFQQSPPKITIPYRIDLAGGWLDQPFVSKYHAGSVLTISIEPTIEFNERSGMASSTRKKAIELWEYSLPADDPIKLGKILFSYDNPPGTIVFSGSQDALGIVLPGLNKLYYDKDYWPKEVTSINDESILEFIENHLVLVNLGPCPSRFNVLEYTDINSENAANLADAADRCWKAIQNKDLEIFGKSFRDSFEAQIRMFPNMLNTSITNKIGKYKEQAFGWKLSGAGGGGYLVLVTEKEIPMSIKIKIRRKCL